MGNCASGNTFESDAVPQCRICGKAAAAAWHKLPRAARAGWVHNSASHSFCHKHCKAQAELGQEEYNKERCLYAAAKQLYPRQRLCLTPRKDPTRESGDEDTRSFCQLWQPDTQQQQQQQAGAARSAAPAAAKQQEGPVAAASLITSTAAVSASVAVAGGSDCCCTASAGATPWPKLHRAATCGAGCLAAKALSLPGVRPPKQQQQHQQQQQALQQRQQAAQQQHSPLEASCLPAVPFRDDSESGEEAGEEEGGPRCGPAASASPREAFAALPAEQRRRSLKGRMRVWEMGQLRQLEACSPEVEEEDLWPSSASAASSSADSSARSGCEWLAGGAEEGASASAGAGGAAAGSAGARAAAAGALQEADFLTPQDLARLPLPDAQQRQRQRRRHHRRQRQPLGKLVAVRESEEEWLPEQCEQQAGVQLQQEQQRYEGQQEQEEGDKPSRWRHLGFTRSRSGGSSGSGGGSRGRPGNGRSGSLLQPPAHQNRAYEEDGGFLGSGASSQSSSGVSSPDSAYGSGAAGSTRSSAGGLHLLPQKVLQQKVHPQQQKVQHSASPLLSLSKSDRYSSGSGGAIPYPGTPSGASGGGRGVRHLASDSSIASSLEACWEA